MRQNQNGFTLFELIIVVGIFGVAAALSVPKFLELSTRTQIATTTSVAASLSAANAVNYISRKSNAAMGVAVANCTDIANIAQRGLPQGYTIASVAAAQDTTVNCTLTGPEAISASFVATGIG